MAARPNLPPTEKPSSLLDFQRQFPDEKACVTYLVQVRWPDGFKCPTCGSDRYWILPSRWILECENRHQTSPTAGTVMHRTKQPVQLWFYAAYLVSTLTPGISAVQFQRQLGLSRYETAFQMLHKLRSALVAPGREPLTGLVEMDEEYIENRNQKKMIIIGAVEVRSRRDPGEGYSGGSLLEKRPTIAGRLRLKVIPDETAASFLGFASANVAPGSTICTDGDPSYNGLASLGYKHHATVQGRGKDAVYGLKHIHREFSNFKTWLVGTHHGAVLPKHMPAYCNEFVFRFNRRFWRGPAFLRALGLVVAAEERPEYETLYRTGEEGGWQHPNPATDARIFQVIQTRFEEAGDVAMLAWMDGNRPELMGLVREGRRKRAKGVGI
jgi:hypothetical protein